MSELLNLLEGRTILPTKERREKERKKREAAAAAGGTEAPASTETEEDEPVAAFRRPGSPVNPDAEEEEVEADSKGNQFFEGMRPRRNKKLEELATDYEKKRDARMRATEAETEAKAALRDKMKALELDYYPFDDREIVFEHTETDEVKVRKAKKPKASEE